MDSPFYPSQKKPPAPSVDVSYNLEGKVSYDQSNWRQQVARAVTDMTQRMVAAVRGVDELKGAGYLTKAAADQFYGPSVIRHALEVRGSDPLTLYGLPGSGYSPVIVNTWANLPVAGSRAVGDLFWATDRTVLYLVQTVAGANAWVYILGTARTTLAAILTGLGTNDAGLLDFITDYSHTLRWSGSAWTWAPGDDGSGYYRMCESAPAGFGASAWQVVDGSTVDRLNADGSVTSVVLDDLTTPGYLKGGIAAAAVAAASGATAATTATNIAAATGITGANAAATGIAATNAASTGISVNAHSTASDTTVTGAGTRVTTATHTVNDPTHSHTITDPTHVHTITDPTHNHTQNSHTHAPGTLELRNKQVATFYRR